MANMLGGGGGFGGGMSPQDQGMFMKKVEEMQLKDVIRLYNELVERCFSECVTSMRSKSLTGAESGCIDRCSEKFMKYQTRVGQRFQENQMANQMAEQAKQQGTAPAGW